MGWRSSPPLRWRIYSSIITKCLGLGCASTHDACLSWLVARWIIWYGSKTARTKSKNLEPTHDLLADGDGGYGPPCGGSALRNDPSLHKVQWLALISWLLAWVIYPLPFVERGSSQSSRYFARSVNYCVDLSHELLWTRLRIFCSLWGIKI